MVKKYIFNDLMEIKYQKKFHFFNVYPVENRNKLKKNNQKIKKD